MDDGVPASPKTILLVEDDPAVRALVGRMLSQADYRVLSVPGGRQALEQLADYPGPIHLALVDLVLPELNGPEFIQELSRLRDGFQVLFMSGWPRTLLRQGSVSSEVHFLAKPFTRLDLLSQIESLLSAQVV